MFPGYEAAGETLRDMLGITEDEIAGIEARSGGGMERLPSAALSAEEIDPTADLDATLPGALAAVEARLPKEWVEEEPAYAPRGWARGA